MPDSPPLLVGGRAAGQISKAQDPARGESTPCLRLSASGGDDKRAGPLRSLELRARSLWFLAHLFGESLRIGRPREQAVEPYTQIHAGARSADGTPPLSVVRSIGLTEALVG